MSIKDFDIDDIIQNELDEEDIILGKLLSQKKDKGVEKNNSVVIREKGKRGRKPKVREEVDRKISEKKPKKEKQKSRRPRKSNDDDFVYVADLSPEIKQILNAGREGYPPYIYCARRENRMFHTLCCLNVTAKCKKICEYYDFGWNLKNELNIKRRKIYEKNGETVIEDEE